MAPAARQRNIRLLIAFDGTNYKGWQRQADVPTIQGVVEERLAVMTGEPVCLHGAGRTDAGVHALGMVANFHTSCTIPAPGLQRGLNSLLPRDIRIMAVSEEEPGFHSRFSATGKTYRYDFCTAEVILPTARLYMAHRPCSLDVEIVRRCLQLITGSHDFSSFEATGSRDPAQQGGRGAVRTISEARCVPMAGQPGCWSLLFTGDGFLRHMVRNLAGTLIDAGRGRISASDFAAILAGRDRTLAGPTAPACGLFLVRVHYHPSSPVDRGR